MKPIEKMTYRELEQELTVNQVEMVRADIERKRALIRRSHALMTEMDARWDRAGSGRHSAKRQ